MAAVLFASSPVFLYQIVQPMNDVPAAALWLLALVLASRAAARPDWLSQMWTGAAAGAALVVRPNLLPLAAVTALWIATARDGLARSAALPRLVRDRRAAVRAPGHGRAERDVRRTAQVRLRRPRRAVLDGSHRAEPAPLPGVAAADAHADRPACAGGALCARAGPRAVHLCGCWRSPPRRWRAICRTWCSMRGGTCDSSCRQSP